MKARPPNSPGRPSLALPTQDSLVGKKEGEEDVKKPVVVEPNFNPSGALAAETNTFQGTWCLAYGQVLSADEL
jgi:hypothetical protein